MESKPKICQVVTEFTILHKQVELNKGILGNVNHQIDVFHDGSVYLKEVLVTISKDETLHESLSRTFGEFSEKFPEDAEVIRDFINKRMLTIPGIDKRYDL